MSQIISDVYNQIVQVVGTPPEDMEIVAYSTACIALLLTISFIFKVILAIFKR